MKLSLDYLTRRHAFWKYEIGKAGIWDPGLFQDVMIQVRPKCKSYNGLFSRRWMKKNGKRTLVDRIFIYNNSEDFKPEFIDSILVHEMIHQYIYQTKIKDSSTHGRLFKGFMAAINKSFKGKLEINISDRNPSLPESGPGKTMHRLILSWNEKDCYCCVINPNKLTEFDRLIKRYKKNGAVKDFFWAQSNDMYFDRYVKCTKTLHGIKKPMPEMVSFCREYNVVKSPL